MRKSIFLSLLAALLTIFIVDDRCRSGTNENAKVEINDAGQTAVDIIEFEAQHDLLKIEAEVPHDSWEPAEAKLRLYAAYLATDEALSKTSNYQGRRARDGLRWCDIA